MKIFSTMTDVPFAVTNKAAIIACISVGNPGYGFVFISMPFNLLGDSNVILFSSTCI